MKRICVRPWCRSLTIEDGRECPEHTNETLRETRQSRVPEWRTRNLARDMTGALR